MGGGGTLLRQPRADPAALSAAMDDAEARRVRPEEWYDIEYEIAQAEDAKKREAAAALDSVNARLCDWGGPSGKGGKGGGMGGGVGGKGVGGGGGSPMGGMPGYPPHQAVVAKAEDGDAIKRKAQDSCCDDGDGGDGEKMKAERVSDEKAEPSPVSSAAAAPPLASPPTGTHMRAPSARERRPTFKGRTTDQKGGSASGAVLFSLTGVLLFMDRFTPQKMSMTTPPLTFATGVMGRWPPVVRAAARLSE